MALRIDKSRLLQVCKEIIETILFCLPNAYKGTIYRISNPPELIAKEVASGIIDEERKSISWGMPERSIYALPGIPWVEYRDEPGRPLEAMAWCVEKQTSWTAENPENDIRSGRVQLEGLSEGFHHMEPVLIHKKDIYLGDRPHLVYPKNYKDETIWQDSHFIVVDVIKIHFRPNTIKINSPETEVIKKLSWVFGTQLLSHQMRLQSVETMRQLAEDKQRCCNILADSIRNAVTKSGFILSLIKLELEFLREQWEAILLKHSEKKGMKCEAVQTLNNAVTGMGKVSDQLGRDLIDAQNRFLDIHPPPERGENWICMQIEKKWQELLTVNPLDKQSTGEIQHSIDALKRSLYLGKDQDILKDYNTIPESLKKEWIDLLYRDTDLIDLLYLDRLIRILENPSLKLPFRSKSRKSLIRLKVLAEIMGKLEQDTNAVLRQVLNS